MPPNKEPILWYAVFGVTVFFASLYFTFPQKRVAGAYPRVVSVSKTPRTMGAGPAPNLGDRAIPKRVEPQGVASTSQVISGSETPGTVRAVAPAPKVAPNSHRGERYGEMP